MDVPFLFEFSICLCHACVVWVQLYDVQLLALVVSFLSYVDALRLEEIGKDFYRCVTCLYVCGCILFSDEGLGRGCGRGGGG